MAALAMVALLAFVGLVLSAGLFLVERRHLQNAADAIALAATWRVLDEQTSRVFLDSAVLAAAGRLVTENKVAGRALSLVYVDQTGSVRGNVGSGIMPPAAAGVRVHLSGPFQTILAGFVGTDTIQVSADGEARLVPVAQPAPPAGLAQAAGLLPLVPVAVPRARYLDAVSKPVGSPVATSYDLYSVPDLFLDLRTVTNGRAARSFGDMHTNLQYWSDGSHQYWSDGSPADATLVVGSQVALATPIPASTAYAPDVQSGLSDNWRRQKLPTDAAYTGLGWPDYLLISLPLCEPCSAPNVTVVGFARFKLVKTDIRVGSLVGWFVPFTNDPSTIVRQPGGPLWGPSAVALTR